MSDRGVSTPIDVGLGILLVSGAVALLVGMQPPVETGMTPDGPVLVGSTIEVSYSVDGRSTAVAGTMGGLVGDAVLAGRGTVTPQDRAFRRAVRRSVDRRIEHFTVPMQVLGYCAATSRGPQFVAGADVPPSEPVQASVFQVPARRTADAVASDRGEPAEGSAASGPKCDPRVVVRWWHP
jgi:hypothetical protein